MFWNRLASLLLGSSMIVARPLIHADSERIGVGELMTYECARDVASLADLAKPVGPLFSVSDLLLTSIVDASAHAQLVVTAGGGVYALDLPHEGLNRLRFDLVDQNARKTVTYYLGYFHDSRQGSRMLEFAADQPPVGHFEFDYLAAVPRRAAYLLPHLEYAIFTTSTNLRQAIAEGKVTRAQLRARSANSCDHLERENPALARSLQHNLNVLDGFAGMPARMPASLR